MKLEAAPGHAADVKKIVAGFIQIITVNRAEARYSGEGLGLVNPAEGSTYLDNDQDGDAWYGNKPDQLISDANMNAVDGVVQPIGGNDTPFAEVPAVYELLSADEITAQLGSGKLHPLQELWYNDSFKLNVAAQTTDSANGASHLHWAESAVGWVSNLDGKASAPSLRDPEGLYISWDMGQSQVGVLPPGGWQAVASPTLVPTWLPTGNTQLENPGLVPVP